MPSPIFRYYFDLKVKGKSRKAIKHWKLDTFSSGDWRENSRVLKKIKVLTGLDLDELIVKVEKGKQHGFTIK